MSTSDKVLIGEPCLVLVVFNIIRSFEQVDYKTCRWSQLAPQKCTKKDEITTRIKKRLSLQSIEASVDTPRIISAALDASSFMIPVLILHLYTNFSVSFTETIVHCLLKSSNQLSRNIPFCATKSGVYFYPARYQGSLFAWCPWMTCLYKWSVMSRILLIVHHTHGHIHCSACLSKHEWICGILLPKDI